MPITIERIQQVGERVPLLANLQPHGPYAMVSLHEIGGVPIVMKELLRAGLLHGDVMTVTGKTLAENLAAVPTLDEIASQDIVRPVASPVAAAEQPYQRAERQPRAGELPAEAIRQDPGEGRVPRHRARVRVGGRYDEGYPRRRDRARHRHRGAQCRAGRRARHARDGDAHDPAAGTRPWRRCRADHRRPLFRREPRHPDRSHLAGSGARRPDCGGARWRHDRHRSWRANAQPGSLPAKSSPDAWPIGGRPIPPGACVRARCTTSTSGWFRPRITAAWCDRAAGQASVHLAANAAFQYASICVTRSGGSGHTRDRSRTSDRSRGPSERTRARLWRGQGRSAPWASGRRRWPQWDRHPRRASRS